MSEKNSMVIPPAPALSYWVVPKRFLVGCHPRGGSKRLLEFLALDINTFISLQPADEKGAADYSRALYRAAATLHRKVHFLRRPIPDAGVCSPRQMSEILNAIDKRLAEGHRIYLHCWAGLGRTGLVIGCWLIRHGLSGNAAMRQMEILRSHDAELKTWSSPQTPQQRDMVLCWRSLERIEHDQRQARFKGR